MILRRNCALHFVCLILTLQVISGEMYEHAVWLLRNKTDFYDRSLRPVKNQSTTLIVDILFDLVSIQGFDEVEESLTIIGGLSLNWTDEFMTWNPEEYGGMKEIVSESGKFWMPDLILLNNVNRLDKVGEDWQRVRFTNEGLASVIQGDTFSTSCSFDVTYYPWDSHWCDFAFSTVAYTYLEMLLRPASGVGTSYLLENGAWSFVDSNAVARYKNSSVLFSMKLARKPVFVFVNIIIPIIVLAFLSAFIFLIPAESGERISYSITVLLAIAVFLTLVGENLPKTSNPMAYFSFYLLTVLIISFAITLANIFSLRLYHHDNTEPVTGLYITLTRCWQCKNICNKKNKRVENSKACVSMSIDDLKEDGLKNNTELKSPQTIISGQSRDCVQDISQEMTWKVISLTFDKICFLVFNFILIFATIIFFLVIYCRKR